VRRGFPGLNRYCTPFFVWGLDPRCGVFFHLVSFSLFFFRGRGFTGCALRTPTRCWSRCKCQFPKPRYPSPKIPMVDIPPPTLHVILVFQPSQELAPLTNVPRNPATHPGGCFCFSFRTRCAPGNFGREIGPFFFFFFWFGRSRWALCPFLRAHPPSLAGGPASPFFLPHCLSLEFLRCLLRRELFPPFSFRDACFTFRLLDVFFLRSWLGAVLD